MVSDSDRRGLNAGNLTFLAALLAIGLVTSGCQVPVIEGSEPDRSTVTTVEVTAEPTTTSLPASLSMDEVVVRVVSVVDGDTVRVLMPDGHEERVRLIGIDAPEDGSLLDHEATSYLEGLVLGEEVRLVGDVSDRDPFGRLLRYLYVGDLFVNEEMVRAGLAVAKRYEPDTAMAGVLEAAQDKAENGALGLFSAVRATATTASAGCHPSYPEFCVPPPPPDLDCGDIGQKNFRVLPPDPHGFDGNSDGVGCES